MPFSPSSTNAALMKQVIKFSLTGLFSALINFISYIFVYNLFGSLVGASIVGYLVGLINSYAVGRSWVFNVKREISIREIVIFLTIYVAGGMGMTLIIYFGDVIFSLDYRLAWCLGAMYAVFNNFIGSKFLVFKIN